MFLDQKTIDALDFQYVYDKIDCITPYGNIFKSRMHCYKPGEEETLSQQFMMLESFIPFIKDTSIRSGFNNILSHFKDLRQSIKRANDGFILNDVEFFEIKSMLYFLRDFSEFIKDNNIPVYEETKIIPIEPLEKLLDPENTKISSFYIYDIYSEELKNIRDKKREIDKKLKTELKNIRESIKEELKLDVRPDNTVVISKDKKDILDKIKENPNLNYVSETYLNVKFSIKTTEVIDRLEKELNLLRKKEELEEMRIREILTKEIKKHQRAIYRNISSVGKLDLLIAKAKFAVDYNCVKPQIVKEHIIEIEDGIHPKVAEMLSKKDLKFTPISISLKKGVTCITGANMGGKTITLKLVGLLTAMAQYGMFVTAKKMTLGLNEYIKSSIGDMQSTDSGLSTFGGEVKVVKEAIERASERGLILIDELARGTNPEEGYAISKAIVEYLKDKNAITVLTTHYDNVADLEEVVHLQVVGLSNLDINKLKDEISLEEGFGIINKHMDYRLRKVDKDTPIPRDALNIARIMGLNEEIISLAEKNLKKNQ
ncbi:MAG: DNA mismatch repair protein MutS [Tissierellales bacterium]|nr:DNA mismatch repair protein MutS [Tissierellales bacterium]